MLLKYLIKVVEEFLRDYSVRLTGSFIAKKKRLNQKTVANYLNELEKEQILKSEIEGRNKYYYLNFDDREIIKNFILAIEHLRTIDFYKKNILIKEIVEKVLPHIKGIALIFGSYAKNLQKQDSDLDILVIGKADEREISKISEMYNKEISLKVYSRLKKDTLTREALKDHIIIKNPEQLIENLIELIQK